MWQRFFPVLVLVLLQNIVIIQCHHANVDAAKLLSKTIPKKLNQTGISAEIIPIQSEGIHIKKSVASTTNSSQHIDDFANFVTDLDHWVILGQWARYHLTFFTGDKPIPKIPSSIDQSVLICTVNKFPSSLTKEFVGLSNAALTIVHYVSFKKDISIEGLISSNNKTEVFFTLNKEDLYEKNNNWVINTFTIPPHFKNMTIILQPRSSSDAKWAIGSIKVNGTHTTGKATPIVIQPELPKKKKAATPTTTTTSAPLTTKAPNITLPLNVTTANPVTNSSSLPLLNVTNSEDEEEVTITEDPLQEIHGVASAIWNAFYVFLALFCACMIALIVLVLRQR